MLWDLTSNVCTKTLYGHINNINSLINLNDETIVSCSSDKTFKIWDSINDECIKTLQGHSKLIRNVINFDCLMFQG